MTYEQIFYWLQGFFASIAAFAVIGAISLYGVKRWINGSMERWEDCATELKNEIKNMKTEWGGFVQFVADVSRFMREHGWKDD